MLITFVIIGCAIGNILCGIIGTKLATLYDFQNDVTWHDLPFFAIGGVIRLLMAIFFCVTLAPQGLYWHKGEGQ